ncbi:MAG TPA: NHLP leader peptide family RiPP precursor [Gemmatimonadaceae bacterium]|nr:NHLP leader peptide family RiPP precursor [Gemmatimonadaceae bacterium]
MQPSRESERRALDSIVARATVDRAFRQKLLADPRRAIHDELGLTIPSHFRIKFIERGPDLDALVVLPDFREGAEELSEDELEAVSGGAEHYAVWSDPPARVHHDNPNGKSHGQHGPNGSAELER